MLMICGFLVECTGLGFVNEIEEGRRFFFCCFRVIRWLEGGEIRNAGKVNGFGGG